MSELTLCHSGVSDYAEVPALDLDGDFTIASLSIFEIKRVKMKKRGPLKNRYCNIKFGTVFLFGEDDE